MKPENQAVLGDKLAGLLDHTRSRRNESYASGVVSDIANGGDGGGPTRRGPVVQGDAGDKIAATLRARGWSDAAIEGALNNAITESSLNPEAKGAAGERGLFQFHPGSHITPFTQAYKGDWSPEAQANYMADVVEKSMPGYAQSSDGRSATARFLREFENRRIRATPLWTRARLTPVHRARSWVGAAPAPRPPRHSQPPPQAANTSPSHASICGKSVGADHWPRQ